MYFLHTVSIHYEQVGNKKKENDQVANTNQKDMNDNQ